MEVNNIMDLKNRKEESGLSSLYDDLKNKTSVPKNTLNTIPYTQSVHGDAFHKMITKERMKLQDKCGKKILLDIYCRIIPLDDEYVHGHMGQMQGDVDKMLKSKGMNSVQYLTSAYESTHAPLLEFVIRSINNIGKQFVEEAETKVNEEHKKGIDAPMPEAPEDPEDDQNINDQLVDIKKDTEYESFIDKLKQKTINKIVSDISKIITDKKEDQNMTFDPKPIADMKEEMESTTSIGVNYIQAKLLQENVDTSDMTEDILGLAIRESTLNQFDVVFNQKSGTFREFASRIRYNKGILINESAVAAFLESTKSPEEVNSTIAKAKKEFDDKIDSELKASDIIKSKDNQENDDKK